MPRHNKPQYPCRELTCDRLALSRALCAKHYWRAKKGELMPLKYSATEEPQRVPWLELPNPIPGITDITRPKWEWPGDEAALIAADPTNLEQEPEDNE